MKELLETNFEFGWEFVYELGWEWKGKLNVNLDGAWMRNRMGNKYANLTGNLDRMQS